MIDEITDERDSWFFNSTPPKSHSLPAWRLVGQIAFSSLASVGAFTVFMGGRKKRNITDTTLVSTQPSSPISHIDTNSAPEEYDQLLCTSVEKDLVYQVISPLGHYYAYELWAAEVKLNQIGNSFRERLHPFKFLEIIFHHPELRTIVQTIFESNSWLSQAKQAGFLKGVRWGMEEYGRRGKILSYIPAFVKKMGPRMSEQKIRSFIQQKNWDGLVRHVCENSSLPEERKSQA